MIQGNHTDKYPRPWDSLGKNTGVGCHFLLQCMKVKSESEVAQKVKSLSRIRLLATPWTVAYQAPPSMGFSRQDKLFCSIFVVAVYRIQLFGLQRS